MRHFASRHRHVSRPRFAGLVAVAVLAGACAGSGDDPAPTTSTAATTTSTAAVTSSGPTTTTTVAPSNPDLTGVTVGLEPVVEVAFPTDLAAHPGTGSLYVLEREGRVWLVEDPDRPRPPRRLALDLVDEVSADFERGLLGVAFAPDGGVAYLHWTDAAGDTRVVEFPVAADGTLDESGRRELLHVEQPSPVHNGGDLAVTEEGLLYVALGYGANDFDETDIAQRTDTLLGKILRIDPAPQGDEPYTIPTDNPFVGVEGARPEIWVLGLRNPWRFSIDPPTGDLWIGDVGQFVWEELDWLAPERQPGANLGWARLEGAHPFRGRSAPDDHVLPVHEFNHDDGSCAVTGGVVYRGSAIPALRGAYVWADFCRARIRALTHVEGGEVEVWDLGEGRPQQTAFGVDRDGELYLLSGEGSVSRLIPA